MLVALNSLLRHQRRRLVAVAAVLCLAGAVVAAHSALAGDHMGDDGVAMCLAVIETGAVVLLAAKAAGSLAARRQPVVLPAPNLPDPAAPATPVPKLARAGPADFQVFLL